MQETSDKGPIRHLGKHVLKYDKIHNLEVIANQTHQLHKWLENKYIDKALSNVFWTIQVLKLPNGTDMGHAWKQLFFGRKTYL